MSTAKESIRPPVSSTASPDLEAFKAKQRITWASGDFAVIGSTLQIVGESLAEAADIRAGEQVLDVAAGNGNATLAAARRFAHVTSTDYVPELLEKGAARAQPKASPLKTFAALDETGQHRLEADLTELLERRNVAGRGSLVVPGEYLEVVVVRH